MISPVKIPYYPNVQATLTETIFGAVEISCPDIYNKAIPNKVIVRVDLLECLRSIWGDDCQIYRCLLYKLVSGTCSTEEHRQLFASFYRKYKPITTIIERTVVPVRAMIEDYRNEVSEVFTAKGGKYLTRTHDYVYYAFVPGAALPEMKGITVIC